MRCVALKFMAFLLAALCVICAIASLLGIAVLGQQGLYDKDFYAETKQTLKERGEGIAARCLEAYASYKLGNCPEDLLLEQYGDLYASAQGSWNVTICQGEEVLDTLSGAPSRSQTFEYTMSVLYLSMDTPDTGFVDPFRIYLDENEVEYALYEYRSPEYTVILDLHPDLATGNHYEWVEWLYHYRYHLIALAAASILIFSACLVYLCWVAGRSPGTRVIRPGGLNRLPLDLYLGILALLSYLVLYLGIGQIREATRWGFEKTAISLGVTVSLVLSLLLLALVFVLAAQLKTEDGYWWRRSLLGRCFLTAGKGIGWFCKAGYRMFCLIPAVWQLVLVGLGAGLVMFLLLIVALQTNDLLWRLGILFVPVCYLAFLVYLCYAYGTLFQGVQRMKKGDLTHRISPRFLVGSFKEFALGLNAVSQSAGLAAEKQLRSERMKTELITNVSHDIKTPLTSITNYVDLLQKPHTPEEAAQYLEVLSRQSLRLKKLVDDLMEMNKASTGNIPTQITRLDAVEAVTQALGEFSDKLEGAELTPVLNAPESPVLIMADSRLLWRVLSNLLSNTVKYALPGTRLYVSVRRHERHVVISIKNISKEQLGISADELMERFVRGDVSRNTEGSGLGLNIAKSLMELQKGQLRLLVDGDLFKVTLIFPGV